MTQITATRPGASHSTSTIQSRKPLPKGSIEVLDRDAGTVLTFSSHDACDLYRLTGQATWSNIRPASKRDQALPTASGW